MGVKFSSTFSGGSTSGFKAYMQTGDEAAQRLLVTLRREEQNTRLEVKELQKTVRALSKKGIFEAGDDDDNPELSAESVVTRLLSLERFRNKCIALNTKIVKWHGFYNVQGTGTSDTGTASGTYNSPQFRATVRRIAQTLANLRSDEIYREKNGPLETAAEKEWPEPLIIEDRIRTFCDYGGDQGHAADPIPNGVEFAEVDAAFTTEDYLEAYAKADVKSFEVDAGKTYYEGAGKAKRWYGSGAPVRQHTLEDTSTRAFGR